MNKTWTKRLGAILAILFGASLLAVASPAGPAAATTETMTVQSAVRFEYKTKETPIPSGGTSYYCALGAFVSFNEIAGWTPDTVTVDYFGKPWSKPIGAAPYADGAAINGLVFPPVGGSHQTQLGVFSYGQGGSPSLLTDTCPLTLTRLKSFYAATATITYTREVVDVSQKCAKAQAEFEKTVANVRTIQRKVTSLNKQIKQLNQDIEKAEKAGRTSQVRSLTKQLNNKQESLSNKRDKLREAKRDRAKASSAAAKACRD